MEKAGDDMEPEKKQEKKSAQWFEKYWLVAFLILSILFLLLVHVLFSIYTTHNWLQAKWTAGELLTYVGTVSLGILSLWQNKQLQAINEKQRRQNEVREIQMRQEDQAREDKAQKEAIAREDAIRKDAIDREDAIRRDSQAREQVLVKKEEARRKRDSNIALLPHRLDVLKGISFQKYDEVLFEATTLFEPSIPQKIRQLADYLAEIKLIDTKIELYMECFKESDPEGYQEFLEAEAAEDIYGMDELTKDRWFVTDKLPGFGAEPIDYQILSSSGAETKEAYSKLQADLIYEVQTIISEGIAM